MMYGSEEASKKGLKVMIKHEITDQNTLEEASKKGLKD